jgi:3-oxoadipate enol-lactonase
MREVRFGGPETDMDRRSIGEHELQAIDGERGAAVVRAVRQVSPTLADALTEFAFGQVFCRAELGRRERELATVAILAAIGGAETQLRVHLGAALRSGVDPDELIALCEHVAPYAGLPRALNLLREARAILEELDITRPRPARRVRVGDHETIVSETGQGEPYLLIHCLGLDWRLWRDVIPELGEQYRVVAYDLRGHGYAANAPKLESIEQLSDDLVLLMDELNLKRAHIAGHSLGGAVAQIFALQHPERVMSLALVNTMSRALRDRYEARAEDAERNGMASQVAPSLLRWLTPEAVAENAWYVRYARERVIRSQVPNWAAAWRALAAFDAFDNLQNIQAPTQVIGGEKDIASPAEEFMRPIADRIPHAKFTVIPGAPHLSPLVNPHELATLLSHV